MGRRWPAGTSWSVVGYRALGERRWRQANRRGLQRVPVGNLRPGYDLGRNRRRSLRSCRPSSCTPGGTQKLVIRGWLTQGPGKAVGTLKRRRAVGVAELRRRVRELCGGRGERRCESEEAGERARRTGGAATGLRRPCRPRPRQCRRDLECPFALPMPPADLKARPYLADFMRPSAVLTPLPARLRRANKSRILLLPGNFRSL
jgi:hypothetical protein